MNEPLSKSLLAVGRFLSIGGFTITAYQMGYSAQLLDSTETAICYKLQI